MDGEKRYIVPVKYFVLGEATVVAALLGHSNTTMIHRHYSHVAQRSRELRAAAERIGRAAG